MKLLLLRLLLSSAILLTCACTDNDGLPQQADPNFKPKNSTKSFSQQNSPVVFIDEAHNNFHTAKGRYKAFAEVLSSDGYTVKRNKEAFTLESLKEASILVIANALDANRHDWTPPYLDAFSTEEVHVIKQWVTKGGALFLIADHIPFPKASESLSRAFGFKFSNGHVDEAMFRIEDGSLAKHATTIVKRYDTYSKNDTNNFNSYVKSVSETIKQVRTFGGSAFQPPEHAQTLLILGKEVISHEPIIPFQINAKTPKVSMEGWSQGAVLEVGDGRIAVFSEAMMFTSQVYLPTGKKLGLVSRGAEQNEQFLLNIMHWLTKKT